MTFLSLCARAWHENTLLFSACNSNSLVHTTPFEESASFFACQSVLQPWAATDFFLSPPPSFQQPGHVHRPRDSAAAGVPLPPERGGLFRVHEDHGQGVHGDAHGRDEPGRDGQGEIDRRTLSSYLVEHA